MRLLLDTHYVYAIAGAPGRLSAGERAFLSNPGGRFVVSAVSLWEMRLKWSALFASGTRKGPLSPNTALDILQRQPLDFLDLTPRHAAAILATPVPHNDPFDELLLVQAQEEGLRLLTRDKALLTHPLAVAAVSAP